jgi:cell filamentation protein
MSFDPFYDFASRGYLRNNAGLHDPTAVKEYEHRAFLAKLDQAFQNLARIDRLTYRDVLDTHKTLFEAVYPWAGQDRMQTAPDIAVSKGDILFAHPKDAHTAVEYALQLGHDKDLMASKPGEIMGYFAYGHPFLDGNGRTIMVVHTELAQRAGISIDWAATDKTAYLTALTRELDSPGQGHLDAYLKPYVRAAVGQQNLAAHVAQTQGLDGNPNQPLGTNEVLGSFNEPALQARYQQQQLRRQELTGDQQSEQEKAFNRGMAEAQEQGQKQTR